MLNVIMANADKHPPRHSPLLRAAFSFAFYAMLRPSEYMMTLKHNTFDETRHMRA